MKFRKLMQVGMLAGTALTAAANAQAQTRYDGGNQGYYGDNRGYNRDVQRDVRKREKLERQIEADRRAVDKERRELSHSNWYKQGHERRELTNAERRLERDLAELRALDAHIGRDTGRSGYRY
jgi:hypothetical protein